MDVEVETVFTMAARVAVVAHGRRRVRQSVLAYRGLECTHESLLVHAALLAHQLVQTDPRSGLAPSDQKVALHFFVAGQQVVEPLAERHNDYDLWAG